MNPATTCHVEPGDQVTVTVTGTVVDPARSDYPTHVRVNRRADLLMYGGGDPVSVDLVLDARAVVTTDVKPRHRNGVHIDANGEYWMRRPDGWHRMRIDAVPAGARTSVAPGAGRRSFTPRKAQRLKEDRS